MSIIFTSINMFLSVVMGAIFLALIGVYLPDTLAVMFDWGDGVADWIYHIGIDPQVMNVVRFLINGPQMVFLALVILSRILLSIIIGMFRSLFGR